MGDLGRFCCQNAEVALALALLLSKIPSMVNTWFMERHNGIDT